MKFLLASRGGPITTQTRRSGDRPPRVYSLVGCDYPLVRADLLRDLFSAADDRPVMSAEASKEGDALSLEFRDGRTDVLVTGRDVESSPPEPAPTPRQKTKPAKKKTRAKKPPSEPSDQGSLFS